MLPAARLHGRGEMRVDRRLAALSGEIDRIMSAGPIGRWSNIPATFPFNTETVVFNPDGSGLITSWSALSGKSVQTFAWTMERPGRLLMRYRLTRYGVDDEGAAGEPAETPELSPVAFGIEVVVQDTDYGSWPALVSEGSDVFDFLRTGLARTDPPLRLEEGAAAGLRPQRSFLSRMRSLMFGPRMDGHADA
jgi:hypothetical protein